MNATADIIDRDRLAEITVLSGGCHADPASGMSVMEAAGYIAREPWSGYPKCVSPVISAFLRSWGDAIADDAERTTLLLPLLPKVVGTRGSQALEERRSRMAADWLVRTHTPAWLRLAGLTVQADALSNLPEIVSTAQILSIREPIGAALRDAGSARDAAWAATMAADRAATWAATGIIPWLGRAAAEVVPWIARAAAEVALKAAEDAAMAAGVTDGDAVPQDTRTQLQQSAAALIERMAAAKDSPAAEAKASGRGA